MEPPPDTTGLVPRCRPVEGVWQGHARGRRLIFLHIPKTAGTAITTFLRQQFADDDVMPQLQANFHRSHPLWPLVARRYRLLGVGMHLDHDRVAALARGLTEEAPPFLLTVLREPRARLLSRYKEWRSTPDEHMQAARDHVKEAILTARTKSFSEFLHSDNPVVIDQLKNLQARLLAGLNFSFKASDQEILERARANLAQYDLVGVTRNCDAAMSMLSAAFDWETALENVPKLHVSNPLSPHDSITTPEDDARIASLTNLDQALWNDFVSGANGQNLTSASNSATNSTCHSNAFAQTNVQDLPSPLKPSPAVENLGPGYLTVQEIIATYAPEVVIGLGRKRWYPPPEAHTNLPSHQRTLFVLRSQALSHWRSYVVERCHVFQDSLLALTEIAYLDPRLPWLLRTPRMRGHASLHGNEHETVLTLAIGRLHSEGGTTSLDAAVEAIERLQDTHPSSLRTLHDSPTTRVLISLDLRLCLTAAFAVLRENALDKAQELLLATLAPENHQLSYGSHAEKPCLLNQEWDELVALLARANPTLHASLANKLHTVAARAFGEESRSSSLESQPLETLLDLYEALFHLLGQLPPHGSNSAVYPSD
jgi:hypothetical protein